MSCVRETVSGAKDLAVRTARDFVRAPVAAVAACGLARPTVVGGPGV